MLRFYMMIILVSLLAACGADGSTYKASEGKNRKVGLNMTGQELFAKHCKLCHGIDGRLQMNGAKDFKLSELSLEDRIVVITEGKNAMTPFKKILTPDEIKKVAAYTIKLSEKE